MVCFTMNSSAIYLSISSDYNAFSLSRGCIVIRVYATYYTQEQAATLILSQHVMFGIKKNVQNWPHFLEPHISLLRLLTQSTDHSFNSC